MGKAKRSMTGGETLHRESKTLHEGFPLLHGAQQGRGKAKTKGKSEMTPRYITVRGAGVAASSPYYIGHVQNVKARLASALPAGQYTLKVYTRSGFGDQFGVKAATRRVTVA